MFNTPPKTSRRERKKITDRLECAAEHVLAKTREKEVEMASCAHSSVSREPSKQMEILQQSIKNESVATSRRSRSSEVRRAQLKLEAARAKAQIQMDLIDKKLEADLAIVDNEEQKSACPSRCSHCLDGAHGRSNVEEWLEQSAQPPQVPEEEPAAATTAARVPQLATNERPDQLHSPAPPVDSILQLAHTLKDIMVTSSTQREDRLLTRLSTPRELPTFSGDCMEWLHFKNAYEDSSRVCGFSAAENLARLRRALRGDAKESVTDLLIGNTPPEAVMKSLELRFGRSDIIIQHITSKLKKLAPLPLNYQHDIINFSIKLNNSVATLRALNKNDYLQSPELFSSIITKLPGTLIGKWTEFAFSKLADDQTQIYNKLELLASFLEREVEIISVTGVAQPREEKRPEYAAHNSKPYDKPRHSHRPVLATKSTLSINLCRFCKRSEHLLSECRHFKRALKKERWRYVKTNNLCFCCLQARHNIDSTCPAPVCDINNCGLAHHKLLHYTKPTNQITEEISQASSPTDESSPSNTVALVSSPTGPQSEKGERPPPNRARCDVLLKVVKVNLCGTTGIISAYALLDDGASISMIDASLAKELGLKSVQSDSIKFIDAFGLEIYQANAPKICAKIASSDDSQYYDISLRQVDKLNLPMQDLSIINNLNCKHLLDIKNYVCKQCVVPRLLIGEDNYFLLAPLETIHGNKTEPYATRCRLGWSIHGCVGLAHTPAKAHICCLDRSDNEVSHFKYLNDLVKQSFELDSIGISTLRRENTAHLRAVEILDSTARYLGDRWEVGLPFVKDNFSLPDSFEYARSRLQGILRKCKTDKLYANMYDNEITKLFDHGYARELKENELSASHIWYLSHFGVKNPNKPGKLRLVFDGAGRVQGVCLNDFLLTGPDLYNSLFGIMLRFREHEIVLIGDTKDMFLQIKIRAEDQHVLRFLWQSSLDAPLKICVMQSLIFGATCSPFIAQYIKNKNAMKFQDLYPNAVDVIINNHYIDDCLHSCKTENEAIQLVRDISFIHKAGGFEITRWSSNSKPVLRSIPIDALAHTAVEFNHGANNITERTLGLIYYPSSDSFGFKISVDRIPQNILEGIEPPTKAKMLSIIMSVYDLHGFLSPFIIKGKIIFQFVHRSGIGWNERIQTDEQNKWVNWLSDLKQLSSLRIPRCYANTSAWTECYDQNESAHFNCNNIVQELHIFCDASLKSYASALYWRFIRPDGCVLVCFVASKSRVSPLRPLSVPRLELQSALLGARLAKTVANEHKDTKPTKRYFWSDSSTVLQWIRSDPRDYKPYVAHRLGEIDELTKRCEWRHVPSTLNVADIATRDDAPPLTYSDIWFQGPSFLRRPEEEWPKDRKFTKLSEDVKCEERSVHVVTIENSELFLPNENNISSWITLVRATARVLLFIKKCQRKDVKLDVNLMREAEELLIKKCQRDSFNIELSSLNNNKPLLNNSRLLQLSPYIDKSGILRVGGRIDKVVGVDLCTMRPAILDGRHRITRLLVEYYHRQAMHGANELVVNQLRQRYWVLKLRPTVRSISSKCLFCRYRRAIPQPQRMADLPAARLQHNRRPFTYSGVDFFGPLEVTLGRRRQKKYGMIFTCLTIRAIHIELTEDLTTDSTIMALRRMAARRGLPSVIYSDNGTNLRGADAELKRSMAELDRDALQSDGAIRGLEWRFIPPGAPEMGGAWERMIRTVKSALKVILRERAPHPDSLATLLAEVEGLVNSRPITHVSTDPNFPEALTPNHFLIGTSSNGPAFGKYDNGDLCLRKRWRVAQRLADMFWSRWLREYLPTLLPRQKWTRESRSFQVGDYVILLEPNLDRSCWKHGVVSEIHAGQDGRVRVVDVRTRTGSLRRPVTRVALLSPRDDSAN